MHCSAADGASGPGFDGLLFFTGVNPNPTANTVAPAGDINGDGLADFVVGAAGLSRDDGQLANTAEGRLYVIFGQADWLG